MKPFNSNRQSGATLLVALVLLAVVTVLTVSNMREVTLEGRMTANRMQAQQLLLASESALREAEKRYYGPAHIEDKLTEKSANCQKSNVYKMQANKPCLINLSETLNLEDHLAFQRNPLKFIAESNYLGNWTGAKTDSAGVNAFVPWMPYRGTDPNSTTNLEHKAYWNTVHIPSEGVNAEYGDAIQGKGTYFYLVTAQAADQFALQSTMANIYVGINN